MSDLIIIYKLTRGEFTIAAVINTNDASVTGDTYMADHMRGLFERMEEEGFDPVANMDKIRARLESNYRNGYYWVE